MSFIIPVKGEREVASHNQIVAHVSSYAGTLRKAFLYYQASGSSPKHGIGLWLFYSKLSLPPGCKVKTDKDGSKTYYFNMQGLPITPEGGTFFLRLSFSGGNDHRTALAQSMLPKDLIRCISAFINPRLSASITHVV